MPVGMKITVPGRPVPAVRMTQRSKWTQQARRYLNYKSLVGWRAKAAKIPMMKEPVDVYATAFLHGNREPDVDNLGKSFLDGLNGIAWVDDKQVKRLMVEKVRVLSKEEERAIIVIQRSCQGCVWLIDMVCPFQRCVKHSGWTCEN